MIPNDNQTQDALATDAASSALSVAPPTTPLAQPPMAEDNFFDTMEKAQRNPLTGLVNLSINSLKESNPESISKLYEFHKKFDIPLKDVRLKRRELEDQDRLNRYESQLEDGYYLISPAVADLVNNPDKMPAILDQFQDYKELDQAYNALASGQIRRPSPSIGTIAEGLLSSVETSSEITALGAKQAVADFFKMDQQGFGVSQKNDFDAKKAQLAQELLSPLFQSSLAQDLYQGAESVASSLPPIAAGVVSGLATQSPAVGVNVSSNIMGLQTAASSYFKYRQRGGTPSEAALGGGLEGIAEVIGERLPMGVLFDKFGKGKVKDFFIEYFVKEGLSEQATTLAQGIVDTAIANPDKTWQDYFAKDYPREVYQTAIASLVGSSFFGGATIASQYAPQVSEKTRQIIYDAKNNISELSKAVMRSRNLNDPVIQAVDKVSEETLNASIGNNDYQTLSKITDVIAQKKLKERSPSILSDFIETMTQGKPDTLYLDSVGLLQSGIDLPKLAETSPDIAGQLPDITETGGDIVMPLKDYLINYAGTDLGKSLLAHAKLDPEAMTYAESQAFFQTEQPKLEEQIKNIIEQKKPKDAIAESTKEIEDVVFAKLQMAQRASSDVNRAYAKLTSQLFKTQALEYGINPKDFYDQNKFDITSFVIKDGKPITSPETTDQNGNTQKVLGKYYPEQNVIGLFDGANLTTYLHELGHFYLDMLFRLASSKEPPQRILDDAQAVLKYFGVESQDAWNSLSLEEKTPYHEKFAESFEVYLFEGKAPNSKIRDLFMRFRAWIAAAYRDMTSSPLTRQVLSPEIRQVFDHMIISRGELAKAQDKLGMVPFFQTQQESGLDDKSYEDYVELWKKGDAVALEEIEKKQIRNLALFDSARSKKIKELQKEHKEKRQAIFDESMKELLQEKPYRAIHYIKNGILDGEKTTGQHRLDLEIIKEITVGMYGDFDASLQTLKSKLGRGLSKEGVDPNEIADILGYSSAESMVHDIINVPDLSVAAKTMTDTKMVERYGETYDPKNMERMAIDAVHNDYRLRVIETENRMLDKLSGRTRINTDYAKTYAQKLVSQTIISELRPAQYLNSEARYAKEASRAYKRSQNDNNRDALLVAAEAKRKQLISLYLYKESRDFQEYIKKSIGRIKRIEKAISNGKLRGEALLQIKNLLERFDFRLTSLSSVPAQPSQSLEQFIIDKSQELSAVTPELNENILNESYRKSYKDMTVEEFIGLIDQIKQLEFLARRENQMYMTIRNMGFREESDSIIKELVKKNKTKFDKDGKPIQGNPNPVLRRGEKLDEAGFSYVSEMLAPELIIDIAEAGKQGQLHESIYLRISDAINKKAMMIDEVFKKYFSTPFKAYSFLDKYRIGETPLTFGRKIFLIPKETGQNIEITRENAIMIVAHYGNIEGRERLKSLMDYSDTDVQSIINTVLDPRDIDLIKAIWAAGDEYTWPKLKEINERTSGVAPKKVEAVPFDTKFGLLPGGYVPISYYGLRATQLTEAQTSTEKGKNILRRSSKTKQGTSQKRVDSVDKNLKIRLDFFAYQQKLIETIHDIALREAVADSTKLLNDGKLTKALSAVIGEKSVYRLRQWVQEIAQPPIEHEGWFEQIARAAKRNATRTLLSGFRTALMNFTGVIPAIPEVGLSNILLETARVFGNQRISTNGFSNKTIRFAMENSNMMKNRWNFIDRDQGESVGFVPQNQQTPLSRYALAAMQTFDMIVSSIVWNAGLRKGLEIHQGNFKKAVAYADSKVELTQGSGRQELESKFRRNKNIFFQLFTMFTSYMMKQGEALVRAGAISKTLWQENKVEAASFFSYRFLCIVALPAMILESFSDSEDPWYLRYPASVLLYVSSFVPILPEISRYIAKEVGLDNPYYGVKLTPITSALEGILKAGSSTADIVGGNGDVRDVRNTIMGLGFATGIPGKAIADTITGTYAWLMDDAPASSILLGPPKK